MRSKKESFRWDKWLLIPLGILILIGVVIVYTSSYYLASIKHLGQFHYLIRHFLRLFLGFALLFLALVLPPKFYKRYAFHILGISLLFLIFTFLEGKFTHGAKRWLSIGPFSFQPSEFAKFSLIVYLASFISDNGHKLKTGQGFLKATLVVVSTTLLVALQPSVSLALIIFALGMMLLFVGGARISHILLPALLAGIIGFGLYRTMPHKFEHVRKRLEKYGKIEENYQVLQAHIGMANGGLNGVGIGRGKQKFLYLPEPYTDFIYAVIGEELGFIGALLVLAMYLILALRGFSIAVAMKDDTFLSLLAFGFTMMIFINVLINISVVLGIIPTTGEPLPFISYGGSAMLFNLLAMGILLKISSMANAIKEEKNRRWKIKKLYSLW